LCIGHVAPEAALGGPIALVRNGDLIEIDIEEGRIHVNVSPEELRRRRGEFRAPEPRYAGGVMAKYAKLATSASTGARCLP
jgi:dihydroxy-acid dehydratase